MNTHIQDDQLYDVAIVGMAGRFPQSRTIEEFWHNLRNGVESITFFSDEELIAAGVAPELIHHPRYVKAGAMLEDVELFDAAFFGFNPKEAAFIDPQHRLFLECTWEALERAGYAVDQYEGRIGVYAGSNLNGYLLFHLYTNPELVDSFGGFQTRLANDKDFLATRVSYKLNLHGPSINIQTACSTSLVAVHMACQSLLNQECDMALAGGSSIQLPQKAGYLYQEGMIFSPDGHCRAFDAEAQGTLGSSGAGVVLLKRLGDALADGDQIHAVIKGSAINNDGAAKVGFTAPSVNGQVSVILEAQSMAQIDPATITYIETHGSGTPLGDQIEMAALTQAFQSVEEPTGYCAIGSLKTNIGHLDAAAGVGSLIKTVLSLQHHIIPPSLNFTQPNPAIDFANSPFYVNTTPSEWHADHTPRRAGVSSFGMGGTNAHVIVEEAPDCMPSSSSRSQQVLVLSARTDTALETMTDQLVDHLKQHPEQSLADIAYTSQVGRKRFAHRRMLVCRDRDDALATLEQRHPQRVLTSVRETTNRPVVFLFSGLGDQYLNMSRGLYQAEPVFREWVDRCAIALQRHVGLDIRNVVFVGDFTETQSSDISAQKPDLRAMLRSRANGEDAASQKLHQTYLAQPILFTIEYALAQLWMSWGVQPEAYIGYSLGEYVAACLSEVMSLDDALMLVARRAQMIQDLPGGAMLAVPLSADEIQPLLGDQVSIAAVNSPTLCVIAGPLEAIDAIEQQLLARSIASRRLQTTHAFHSTMLHTIVADMTALAKTVALQPPKTPYISNVTGTWITDEDATDPAYWSRHAVQAVRFAPGIEELWADPQRVLLEIGPGQGLVSLAMQQRPHDSDEDYVALPSMRHGYETQSDLAFLLNTLGQLWLAGVQIDWQAFYAEEQRHRVMLPTYPFERQRYWIEPAHQSANTTVVTPPPTTKTAIDTWFSLQGWKQTALPQPYHIDELKNQGESWLIFADSHGLGTQMVQTLKAAKQNVIVVTPGEDFACIDQNTYTVNPRSQEAYQALLADIHGAGHDIHQIVHLWNMQAHLATISDKEQFDQSQYQGWYSLLWLIQAIEHHQIRTDLKLWVVSNNTQHIESSDIRAPEKTTILGLCQVISQEYSHIRCSHIDMPLPGNTRHLQQSTAYLFSEIQCSPLAKSIAYRGNQRWVHHFEPLSMPKEVVPPAINIRRDGIYLITNGLRGTGQVFARCLASMERVKLVLTDDAMLPPRADWDAWLATHDPHNGISQKLRVARELEEQGAEVALFETQITQRTQFQELMTQISERFGGLHGVIYTAGGGQEHAFCPISDIKQPLYEQQVRLKIQELYALADVLHDQSLDFCLLQSSLASILGGLGLASHAAAHHFMDALVHRQNAEQATLWYSVNWDMWQSDTPDTQQASPNANLHELAITPAEGAEAFIRILSSCTTSHVLVSTSDLQTRLQKWIYASDIRDDHETTAAPHTRPSLRTTYVAPSYDSEKHIARIWQELLGIDQVGIYDNFFQLGGHSLLGTQVISRMRETFEIDIPLQALFEEPTVSGLALIVEDALLSELEAAHHEEVAETSLRER